jgi:hypothetical protein
MIDRQIDPPQQQQRTIDPDLLVIGIHLLHDALLAKQPIISIDEDRARAQRYASAYGALNGPQQEQVTRWLREITLP